PTHGDGLAGELRDRLAQPALHRDPQRLHLPADERRAVVFERDAVARHGCGRRALGAAMKWRQEAPLPARTAPGKEASRGDASMIARGPAAISAGLPA